MGTDLVDKVISDMAAMMPDRPSEAPEARKPPTYEGPRVRCRQCGDTWEAVSLDSESRIAIRHSRDGWSEHVTCAKCWSGTVEFIRDDWPPRFRDVNAEDLNSAIRTPLLEWLATDGCMALLWGPPGTGKTHAGCAVANHDLDRHREVLVATVPDLVQELRRAAGNGHYSSTAERLMEHKGLAVLDDLGAATDTGFAIAELTRIVDKRWAWEWPTIVTSNVDPDQIASRMGPRMASRLVSGLVLELRGDDRRLSRDE